MEGKQAPIQSRREVVENIRGLGVWFPHELFESVEDLELRFRLGELDLPEKTRYIIGQMEEEVDAQSEAMESRIYTAGEWEHTRMYRTR